MAIIDSILGMMSGFLWAAGWAVGLSAILLAVMSPFIYRMIFPLKFIYLKNAGGALNANTITLDKKVVRRGRIHNTTFGPRVWILGVKDTQPMGIVSRDNAIPYEGGGVAYMIYEKEIGQFFPVNPNDKETVQSLSIVLQKKKDDNAILRRIYKQLCDTHPELAGAFHLSKPSRILAPVSFSNHTVQLKPFPIDAVTGYMTAMKMRRERAMRAGWWEKWGQQVITALLVVAVIVTTVLTYEQANKAAELRVKNAGGVVPEAEPAFGESMANRMAGESPPGGAAPT